MGFRTLEMADVTRSSLSAGLRTTQAQREIGLGFWKNLQRRNLRTQDKTVRDGHEQRDSGMWTSDLKLHEHLRADPGRVRGHEEEKAEFKKEAVMEGKLPASGSETHIYRSGAPMSVEQDSWWENTRSW